MHRTWTGNSFHTWYFTCFNAILPNLPTLSLSLSVHKTVLTISTRAPARLTKWCHSYSRKLCLLIFSQILLLRPFFGNIIGYIAKESLFFFLSIFSIFRALNLRGMRFPHLHTRKCTLKHYTHLTSNCVHGDHTSSYGMLEDPCTMHDGYFLHTFLSCFES